MKLKIAMIASLAMTLMAGVALAESPVGAWKGEIFQGSFTLVITETNGSFGGTVESDKGAPSLSDVTFKNDELSFVINFELGSDDIAVRFGGKVDGDTFKGNAYAADFGASYPITMTRVAGSPALAGAIGTWEGETDQGPLTVVIAETDGTLGGTIESVQGITELSDVTFAEGEVAFVVNIEVGDQEMALLFIGSIEGDAFDGRIEVPGADAIPLTLTRAAAPSDPTVAIGEWEGFTDHGPVTVVITETDGELGGTIESLQGITELSDVTFSDGEIAFVALLHTDGGPEFSLRFNGAIAGDTLEGAIEALGLGEMPLALTRAGAEKIPDAPDVVLRAVEEWGTLPNHVRTAIELLVAGEFKE